MDSVPPLGIVLGSLSTESGFSCPTEGCWFASKGMLFFESMAPAPPPHPRFQIERKFDSFRFSASDLCCLPCASILWLYTL